MYYRADFITLTVVAMGLYLVSNIGEKVNGEYLGQTHFAWLMFAIVVSLIYDLLWFYMNNYVSDNSDPEGSVKRFSLRMSYVSFIWRFILLITSPAVSNVFSFAHYAVWAPRPIGNVGTRMPINFLLSWLIRFPFHSCITSFFTFLVVLVPRAFFRLMSCCFLT